MTTAEENAVIIRAFGDRIEFEVVNQPD